MAFAARLGDSIMTGHLCDTVSTIQGQLQSKVKINGKFAAVKGDAITVHNVSVGLSCVPHPSVINIGTAKVLINGIQAARLNDSADLGKITGSSTNVDFGG